MTNSEIAQLLRHVAAALVIKNEKKYYFQILAYQKSADTIESATSQVADLLKENKLEALSGIGTSIRRYIDELIQTGQVIHFAEILAEVPASMFPLLDIPGFGPKKAYKLVTAFNITNPETVIKDIEAHALAGDISPLAGFGEKSQAEILKVINNFKKSSTKTSRMLIPFAQELADTLLAYLKQSPHVVEAYPLGSLRRKKPTIGDLDFAVATNNPKEVLDHFVNYPYAKRIIEQGPATSSIIISGNFQIDLMTQPPGRFGSLLQHFTGSKHHNVKLRDYALKKGLSLSEYGIKHISGENKDQVMPYRTEESFYEAIGLDWVPPELREDTGEIEAAIQHNLPNLIEENDLQGDLHIHSSYPIEPSHDMGKDTIETMLEKAANRGYSYLGLSEHNPSISKHSKEQIYTILKGRKEYIEQLNSSNKYARVINLLEVDILTNGSLAIDDKAATFLDGMIVSIHSAFHMDSKQMTARVLKGLSHPKAKILAHPTGRLLNNRPGYTLLWDEIFDFCARNHKALEINAWPERTDLPDTLIKEAIQAGVKLVIDTDSHALDHMDVMRYGVWNARRGWATKDDILNCLPYNKFVEWLKR